MSPLQGCMFLFVRHIPRVAPWAMEFRPVGACCLFRILYSFRCFVYYNVALTGLHVFVCSSYPQGYHPGLWNVALTGLFLRCPRVGRFRHRRYAFRRIAPTGRYYPARGFNPWDRGSFTILPPPCRGGIMLYLPHCFVHYNVAPTGLPFFLLLIPRVAPWAM